MSNQIYYNGDIITMEDSIYAEAIFINNGIIEKVGIKEDIFKMRDNSTEVINLRGKTLIPSFIDAHSHISAVATTLGLVSLNDANSFDEIVDKIIQFKNDRNIENDEWILGFGYDNNVLKEKSHPTKFVLDSASLENPILIAHKSGHMGVANSLALKKLGINSETNNPDGGYIGRVGNTNEPNGYLEENAFIGLFDYIPQKSLEDTLNLLDKAQNIYLSYGITTCQDGIVGDIEFNLMKIMSNQKRLKLDVIAYIDLKKYKNIVNNNRKYVKTYSNGYKIGGYKIFLDGSPQGRTAWLTKPYKNRKDGYYGYPMHTNEEVEQFIKTSIEEDMQLLAHCNGDAAADQFINSFKCVLNYEECKSYIRPTMIHAQLVRYDQIDSMKMIGIIPSYFINHVYYWGDVHMKNLGLKRASRISPLKTTIDKCVIYTLHQDSPVICPDMLESIWCAVNRVTKDGVVLGAFERISPLEALKGVTINAAYQYFEEDKKGSIKEGKMANLVILDKNPLKVDPMRIKDIKVLKTIKNGKVLYSINESI